MVATARKTSPSSRTCSAAEPPGLTNWGRKARKNTATFGLEMPTRNACRNVRPAGTGAGSAGPDRSARTASTSR